MRLVFFLSLSGTPAISFFLLNELESTGKSINQCTKRWDSVTPFLLMTGQGKVALLYGFSSFQCFFFLDPINTLNAVKTAAWSLQDKKL